ncbi:MAG TPA: sigma-70 family RNA polymerase sigma factor [Opitutus sp.]|nr:sigma-70 family RNA polymerase sigma factor [Opitutus sp.]
MNDDAELIRAYLESHSEDAFARLVRRHIGLVYATALRGAGHDAHLAADVTQTVFTALARKAPSLRGHATLAGWLYVSARLAAAAAVRQERRRRNRESVAQSMNLANLPDAPEPDLAGLRAVLDDALVELKHGDREAILLRFFQERSFPEIGAALAVSEEAARKRVDRALEKLQSALLRRGIASRAAAVASALAVAGAAVVPGGLTEKIAGLAVSHAASAGLASLATTVASHLAPAAAVVALGTLAILPLHRANQSRAAEVTRLSAIATGLPNLRADNLRLAHAIAAADALAGSEAALPALRATLASLPSPAPAAVHGVVTVSPTGTLTWQNRPVTLDQFLAHIQALQASAGDGETQLVIHANGTVYGQMLYPLVEATRAGIKHIVVESDATPNPHFPTSWF